jgi:hypothetical protein
MNAPVVVDASSDINQRTARAIPASPPRHIGTMLLTRSTRFGKPPLAWISV